MKLSLKNRFLLPTLALIIIGMGVSAVISYTLSGKALKSVITEQIGNITDSTLKNMDAWINDRTLDVSSWSREKVYNTALKDSFVGQAARKSANLSLGRLMDDYKYYENICLADPGGELVAAANLERMEKVNVSDREYFQKALQGQLVVSDVVKSEATGKPVFMVSAPVKENNDIVGVIFGVVDLLHFNYQFISPIKVGETGYGYLYRHDGIIIAHPDKKNILSLNMNDFEFGREMIAKKQGWNTYVFNGVEKIVNYKPFQRMGWTLGVGGMTSEFYAPINKLGYINGAVAITVVVLAVAIILLLVRSIVNRINRIAEGLHNGSDQVASASQQVSSASESLAEGASQQAASIEETSSSLEEMSAMTKQNADNAGQADMLMREANQVVTKANASMTDLTRSMEDISKASEETSKIIKTIDEIAFQTNLLALNAAVEAARAGEAGAGFAVVADEVRNLAMRAADAARNTAELIEGTVRKVKDGGELVATTNEAFTQVADSASKVGELVHEIASASKEQADGIEQLNKAVMEMDKVTQQNAANAEESASASEEMNAQAQQMKAMVAELEDLMEGDVRNTAETAMAAGKTQTGKHRMLAPHENKIRYNNPTGHANAKKARPAEIIPFEDDEFKDF